MNSTTTLHVPLEPVIRQQFTNRAKQLGFTSAQGYLRVLIKAAIDGRKIDLDVDDWGQPTDQAADRLNKAAEQAKQGVGLSGPFNTVEDFMKDLKA
jgi:hypothetical protein